MSGARNVSGQAYALTVLTPIRRERESELVEVLDGLPSGANSPLAKVKGTHFARWVVIEDVVYQGEGQRRDHLDRGRLLFTSNFDGDLDTYLENLRTGLGAQADAIWANCLGYPGHADAERFASYLRAHQVESSLFFAAYGDRTVDQVHSSLRTRQRLARFALSAQGRQPAELKRTFLEEFGG